MFGIKNLTRTATLAGLVGISFGLSACGGSNDLVGFNRDVPDEFNVVTRAPLVMPPDMYLRPPAGGSRGPQDQSSTDRGRTAVFGAPQRQEGDLTQDEQTLLSRAGADEVDPDNRPSVNTDGSEPVKKDESFIDSIMFWRSGS